jgi:hypothetical protein
MTRAFDFIMDFLSRGEHSEPYRLDPNGEEPIRQSKLIRRTALRRGGEPEVREEADRYFGMPTTALDYSGRLRLPLYPFTRAASN